ncbi:MAG: peptidyl-prolyl cis-trans isomerase [Bdellovibrionales bacterium]
MNWLLSLSLLAVLSGCDFQRPSLKNKILVDVNGKQLRSERFAQELSFRLRDQDALSAKDPKNLALVKKQIVEDFIVQVLSEEWAKNNGIIVRAEDLEKEVLSIQKSYPDDLAFQQALAEQGLTFKAWRDRLYAMLLQKMVSAKIIESASIPKDAEMQTYYRENIAKFAVPETAQVRQILVNTESDAKSIEVELKRGKRMADLAKKYSISPEGEKGGNVGWVEKGLTDIFESAFRMKTGQRSPVIKSAFGYHIFEVVGRKPARNRSFNEVKDEVRQILVEKNKQSLYLSWLEESIRKARVFKDQAFIDAIKVETKVR